MNWNRSLDDSAKGRYDIIMGRDILNTGKITHKESFMNSYIEEVYELEQARTFTKRLRIILDAKYEK